MVEPTSICDRFITAEEQNACAKKMSKIAPDWYLASTCEKQFDHQAFWTCLQLSNKHQFDPKKMEPCRDDQLKDQERITCLINAANKPGSMKKLKPKKSSKQKPEQKP